MSEQELMERPATQVITQLEIDQRVYDLYDEYGPGSQHCLHNNSTPRYSEAAAKLSWERTVAHFKKYLA